MPKIKLEKGTEIEISQEQLDKLMKSQKKEPAHSLGWTPEEAKDFYSIDHSGDIIYGSTHIFQIRDILLMGNVYKTDKEAQRVLEKQKALRRIHVYMRENDLFFTPDWSDDDGKHQITGWDYIDDEPYDYCCYYSDTSKGNLIFKSEEDMQLVLDNCKKDLEIYLKDY